MKIVDHFWSWIFADYKRDDVNILGLGATSGIPPVVFKTKTIWAINSN